MKTIYPKVIIVVIMVMVAFLINFRYEPDAVKQPKPKVKKVVVIEKVYIRVPVPADSLNSDSTVITLPKQPLVPPTPPPDLKKFRRSRNIHKSGHIS